MIHPAVKLMDAIGRQTRKQGTHYRLLTYCVFLPVSEGMLLYNVMTKCMVLLSQEEHEHLEEQEELIAQWFLVPEDHDDRKLCLQVRSMAKMFRKNAKGYDDYTILTTTDCNARCFYCYEKGFKKTVMSAETARKVATFIIDNYQQNGRKVFITWFGGEPTYNIKVINIICQDLEKAGVDYTSSMISNGYLLDQDVAELAVRLWHLDHVQITLDGPEKTYNRTKAYIYKDTNAYRRVVTNIHTLLKHDIKVSLRLNVGTHNADMMIKFVEELSREFGDYPKCSIYAHALFEVLKDGKDVQRANTYESMKAVRARIVSYGHARKRRIPNHITLHHCRADGENTVVISPNGFLGKCEHHIEDKFWGHIESEQRDEKVLSQFRATCADIPLCTDCAYYPDCIRLKLCENGNWCFPENKEEMYSRMENQMRNEYTRYLEKQDKETEQNEDEEVLSDC